MNTFSLILNTHVVCGYSLEPHGYILTHSVVDTTDTTSHSLPNTRLNISYGTMLSQQIILSMHSGILQLHQIGILTTLQVTESILHLPLTVSLCGVHTNPDSTPI